MPIPNPDQFNQNFTDKAALALQQAAALARAQKHSQVSPLHLLAALLADSAGIPRVLIEKNEIDLQALQTKLQQAFSALPQLLGEKAGASAGSPELAQVLESARHLAQNIKDEFISTEHLFLALLEQPGKAADILRQVGLSRDKLLESLKDLRGSARADSPHPEGKYQVLEKYTLNLTDLARQRKLDPVIGRESEIRRVMQVLSRRTKNNPVLIGEAGVGKTAIVEGLAQRIASGEVPEDLKNKELLVLDLGALIAGTKYRGEFEDRLKALVNQIKARPDKYMLFIDEVHTIVGAGAAEGAMDASNILKPALARGELRVIGATTTAEYRKYLEKDAALERRFQPILVREPSVQETLAILRGLKDKYEAHHGVRIRDAALVAAAELSDRYISGRFLPDKAIDLIDEATSSLRLEIQSRPEVIDKLVRKERQLEVELRALKTEIKNQKIENKSKGKEALDIKKKIRALQKKLASNREKLLALEARWQKERKLLKEIKQLKLDIETLENQAEIAETQEADLDRVAEIRYGKLPAAQKELAQKQAALAALDRERRLLKEEVTASDIARVVARATGVPVEKMLKEEAARLALMEEVLRRRVVGQDRALEVVSDVIRRSRVGLAEPHRPLGVFLFVGPTGVGKTETAKALAEFLFGSDHKLLALDMSEFSERHSVAKLIGAPPGYVGYGESGRLTEKVKREPYQVVLFDEIEKAHPEVYNILLQLMDEGRLTDGQGRTVDFSNTVVIMTSNLAGEKLPDLEETEFEGAILEAVRHHFRPEFLNRIDEIVIFKPLTQQNLEDIIEIQLQKVGGRLKEQGLDFEITPEAKRMLAQQAYSPQYGARPLQRVLKQAILNPLSRILVEKNQEAREELRRVKISLDQGQGFKVECE